MSLSNDAEKAYKWYSRIREFLVWLGVWPTVISIISSTIAGIVAYLQQVPWIFTAVLAFAVFTLGIVCINGVLSYYTKWKLAHTPEVPLEPTFVIPKGYHVVSRKDVWEAASQSATFNTLVVLKKDDAFR